MIPAIKYLCSVAFFLALFVGCERSVFFEDDLSLARRAYLERKLSMAERLAERYLRSEKDPEKRWEAWELMLKAINADVSEPRASLEWLEAMRLEYENDDEKMAAILSQIGKYNGDLKNYARSAEAWNAYLELGELMNEAKVEGFRNLAAMQIGQRHFEAAEETLRQCMGLPFPEHEKIYCTLDLADLNMARERWREVDDLCQQILDAEPNPETLGIASYLRGDALEQLGRKDEAIRQFEAALDTYPNKLVIENRLKHLQKTHLNKSK